MQGIGWVPGGQGAYEGARDGGGRSWKEGEGGPARSRSGKLARVGVKSLTELPVEALLEVPQGRRLGAEPTEFLAVVRVPDGGAGRAGRGHEQPEGPLPLGPGGTPPRSARRGRRGPRSVPRSAGRPASSPAVPPGSDAGTAPQRRRPAPGAKTPHAPPGSAPPTGPAAPTRHPGKGGSRRAHHEPPVRGPLELIPRVPLRKLPQFLVRYHPRQSDPDRPLLPPLSDRGRPLRATLRPPWA